MAERKMTYEENQLINLLHENQLKIVSNCELGPLTCPFRGDIAQIRGEIKGIKEGIELMKKHYSTLKGEKD